MPRCSPLHGGPRWIGSSMAADAAPLRVAWRVVRAAEVLVLVVLLSWSFARLPCAAAVASSVLRVAATVILYPRSVFVLVNAIVVLLIVLSRCDTASSPPPARSLPSPDSRDEQHQFLRFSAAPLLLPPIVETPALRRKEVEEAVFEDKQAVHVTVRAQPPRRTRSETAGTVGGGRRLVASPELRRAESENWRRRRLVSAAAPEEWGAEDKEEFRRAVESFIANQQTRFHREESLVAVAGD
jgi:hypothetical protein